MRKIKQLCIIDSSIDYVDEIMEALEMQNQHYLKETDGEIGFEYVVERRDLSGLPWSVYGYDKKNYLGINYNWLAKDTRGRDSKYYSICYVFDDKNWSEKRIHGWHAGFINGLSIQLLRAVPNSTSNIPNLGIVPTLYLGVIEEMMHSWDNVISKELGINLSKKFGTDWDNGIVHGKSDVQRWVYAGVIKKLKPYLLLLFNDEDMYTLYQNPYKVGEMFAIRNGVKRHIANLETLRRGNMGKDRLWEYESKKEFNIPMYKEDWEALELGSEIQLNMSDKEASLIG